MVAAMPHINDRPGLGAVAADVSRVRPVAGSSSIAAGRALCLVLNRRTGCNQPVRRLRTQRGRRLRNPANQCGHSTRSRSVALAALGVVAISALPACGGGSSGAGKAGDTDVASISSPAASAGSAGPSADPDSGRPQLRLDGSEEEHRKLNNAWVSCLQDHGVKTYTKGSAGAEWIFRGVNASDFPASAKVCALKQPLQPVETDPKKNPHYADDFREWIRCMNSKGLKVVGLPDNAGWNYDSNNQPANSDEIESSCRLEAFSAKK
ncbi:hypothetical protein OHT68_36030 [Streptomyces canus]|uniref:hypothetical protein n=1 Tax=Streptomyces canus TaxID=58343 RepID=UPI002E2982AA|nr:hypothetical protein [Streptomyces canus]